MKRYCLIICLLLVTMVVFSACKSGEMSAKRESPIGVSFVTPEVNILPGETVQLECQLKDEKSTIAFSTSNSDVCSVSEQGVLLGIAPGKATVTASIGEYEKAYLQITVSKDVMASAIHVTMDKDMLEMVTGLEYTLTCTAQRDSSILTDTQVKWSSSNEDVATVVDGKITAVNPGDAVITATVAVESQNYQTSCNVTVYEPYHIELDRTYVELPVGGSFTLLANIYDKNGNIVIPEEQELEWLTSDPSVMTVQDGTFRIISNGSPSAGVRYKGNVASVPVDIFAVSADFFKSGVKDFYGEVGGKTFSGVVYNSSDYQPYFYFSQEGMERIRQYADEKGLETLRIHAYAILLNNAFRVNGKWLSMKKWVSVDIPVSELTDGFWFRSLSEGTTEIYMWFELQ